MAIDEKVDSEPYVRVAIMSGVISIRFLQLHTKQVTEEEWCRVVLGRPTKI